MRLVDAHHHLWDPDDGGSGIAYRWLRERGAPKPFGDPTPIQRDYLAPEYLGESAHEIVGSIHVQSDGAIADPVAETAWLDGVADAHGVPSAIVGFVDLSRGDAEAVISRHMAASPRFRGVRQIVARTEGRPDISFAPREWLDDPVWRANYASLADHGLRFDLQLHPSQMTRAAAFLAEVPDVPVAIDHAGSPHDLSPAGLTLWEAGMEALAALPHVSCKLSGLGMFASGWTETGAMHPVIRAVLALFGPERTMWGSNFPVDGLFGSMDSTVSAIGEGLSEADRPAVFRRTALRFYGLDPTD